MGDKPVEPSYRLRQWEGNRSLGLVLVVAIVLLVIGFGLYLGAFAQGPGPSMADRPLQAWMFFAATVSMVAGFLFLVA